MNNANLAFQFPVPPKSLRVRFGEYGGNLNLKLNGEIKNFENFADIDGTTLGGVQVTVVNGHAANTGILRLNGTINSLILGGQALYIDNIQWPNSIDMAFSIITERGLEPKE